MVCLLELAGKQQSGLCAQSDLIYELIDGLVTKSALPKNDSIRIGLCKRRSSYLRQLTMLASSASAAQRLLHIAAGQPKGCIGKLQQHRVVSVTCSCGLEISMLLHEAGALEYLSCGNVGTFTRCNVSCQVAMHAAAAVKQNVNCTDWM